MTLIEVLEILLPYLGAIICVSAGAVFLGIFITLIKRDEDQ